MNGEWETTQLTAITAALSVLEAPNEGDWRLIELARLGDAPMAGELRVLIPIERVEHQYGTPPETARRSVKWFALFRGSEESTIERLRTEKERYISELGEARSKKTEAEFAKERADADLAEAKKEVEKLGRERARISGQVNDERAKCQKMERDIAKLRKAIGELRMKEILEEQP